MTQTIASYTYDELTRVYTYTVKDDDGEQAIIQTVSDPNEVVELFGFVLQPEPTKRSK